MSAFVHLQVHSEYSIVDGICRIKPLIQAVRDDNMPAIALTDHVNLFALVKFYRQAISAGVKPIIGATLLVKADESDKQNKQHSITVLCQDEQGYKNLCELISRAYIEGQTASAVPLIAKSWLQQYNQGLILLAGMDSEIGQALLAGKDDLAQSKTAYFNELFANRFYLSLTRVGHQGEVIYLESALKLAEALQIPVVATNAVCFIEPRDFEAHDARVCIGQGRVLIDKNRVQTHTVQQYLRSSAEMTELFADIPEALKNSVNIVKRCNLTLTLGEPCLPDFPTPNNQPIKAYLAEIAHQGLEQRLAKIAQSRTVDAATRKCYQERIDTELKVINDMGFPGYFLIVADFIQWAKNNAIPVGPGRGSGAGSLVAYSLQITDLDPIEYELLFERFLNPERVSMPDFDIDFCMEGRDRVIDYVAQKYGRDSVSQIITFGTMAAKAVVRDVGRVLSHPYGFVDKIAKLIPFELGMTLNRALDEEPQLRQRYQSETEVQELIDLALKLEGITRNAGKHAGGVVIAPGKILDFAPLYCEPGGEHRVTQLDKDDAEAIGLVKFDFLGLRTLTIIDWAVQTINSQVEQPVDISEISLVDKKTFVLLLACQTTAVFQLESRGMKDLVKRLKPDCFEEIIALVALFRPGPLQSGMVDDFINRKHGVAKVVYPHPDLEPILKPTYGVILYQEQVMQIAQVLANFTLGGADLLRRAMGKKKLEEMAKQRTLFVEGAVQRKVKEKLANDIFDLMEKFAGYGFNKSHSAAYALVAYQTAWLKAHHPSAFMAAVLSSDMDNTDKVVSFVEEIRAMAITLVPPDINQSAWRFTTNAEQHIIFGLGAIKGVGEAAIESILHSRQHDGAFRDLFDFCARIDLRKANRRVLEALIRAGAMDNLGANRATLLASLDKAIKQAEQSARDRASGQGDLFAQLEDLSADVEFIEQDTWPEKIRLEGEKATLGFYLTGHPIQAYQAELGYLGAKPIGSLISNPGVMVTIAGFVHAIRQMKTKKGHKIAFMTFDDGSGRFDVALFSKNYEKYARYLEKDALLLASGEVVPDDYSGGLKMVLESLQSLNEARSLHSQGILIKLNHNQATPPFAKTLQQLLAPHCPGPCKITLEYCNDAYTTAVPFGKRWRVQPNEELITQLRMLLGHDAVELIY